MWAFLQLWRAGAMLALVGGLLTVAASFVVENGL